MAVWVDSMNVCRARRRLRVSMIGTAVIALWSLTAPEAGAQGLSTAANPWTGPRTPDGQPDVQGSWGIPGGTIQIQQSIEEGSDPQHTAILGQQSRESNVIVDPPDG